MGLGIDMGEGEKWVLSEVLVRRLWKFAKLAEWSEWNPKWRQRCCPMCGGPESYRKHAETCSMLGSLNRLEDLYPQVTQQLPMDPITEIEAKDFEQFLLGGIDQWRKDDAPRDPKRPFWLE
jgi:hypothetical protein